ncbi:MAG: methyltransferase domain-containing protein, partial [Myxococcales bacterium]|nr:methyltransferase domain-containing protein [Myxococcales bacterium]
MPGASEATPFGRQKCFSKWVKAGETVLDLGSGTGKICFIASQVVGAEGKVIGVD